jgi:hypothetical protein
MCLEKRSDKEWKYKIKAQRDGGGDEIQNGGQRKQKGIHIKILKQDT